MLSQSRQRYAQELATQVTASMHELAMPDGRFAIDPTTGVVTVADGLLLDFEAVSSHQITVQASDASGNPAFANVSFTRAKRGPGGQTP